MSQLVIDCLIMGLLLGVVGEVIGFVLVDCADCVDCVVY